MMTARKQYPSDVSDDEWALVAPYLTLLPESAGQRDHPLRAVLRLAAGRAEEPTAAVLDSRTLRSTPESGARAAWDGYKRTRGSKPHLAVDTLGHLLALRVTPANEGDRAAVAELAEAVQDATGDSVTLAYVDQGYTGERAGRKMTSSAIHAAGGGAQAVQADVSSAGDVRRLFDEADQAFGGVDALVNNTGSPAPPWRSTRPATASTTPRRAPWRASRASSPRNSARAASRSTPWPWGRWDGAVPEREK